MPTREEVVNKAKALHLDHDDDIQIDEKPSVVEVRDGYWVQGWLWVPKEELQ